MSRSEQDISRRAADLAIERAIDWLVEKWGEAGSSCPYCKTHEWFVGGPVTLMYERRLGDEKLERMAPHFTVMCRNCGHTILVNAVVAGITPEIIEARWPEE